MWVVTAQRLKLGPAVKLEPSFFANHERELSEADYVKQPSGWNMRKLSRGGCTYVGGQCGGIGQIRKKRNPVGVNGKLLRCKSCGEGHIFILKQNVQTVRKTWRTVVVKANMHNPIIRVTTRKEVLKD